MKTLHPYLQQAFDHAKTLYPIVLARLQEFEKLYDNHQQQLYEGNDDLSKEEFDQAFSSLITDLENITNKDLTNFDLWTTWEINGIEPLAFEIALPKAQGMTLNKSELVDFIDYLFDYERYFDKDSQPFEYRFDYYFIDYVHQILALSFPFSYDFDYFLSHEIKPNKYMAFSKQQIADGIFSELPFSTVKAKHIKKLKSSLK